MNAPYHNKALPAGTVLREWRLEEVLGVGGFGIVYRGKDVYFGETVAIKEYFPGAISDRLDGTTVAPTDSSSEEIYELGRQKFLEEAKVLWNLSRPERHPNIVSVRSLFEIHGTAYMVMDFESGVSLSQMLRDGKTFDQASLLALIRPIAEGLESAHRAGVLHRDIKPANILVNQSGRPVLIDFGSARFESGQATNTKVTFYTPPYAAIEQYVKSYPQGPWTDIYALGVVLYQCVAGDKPPEVLERMHGGVGQALSARQWPGFGRAFTRAVDAAMAIRPAERPQSISDWLKLFDLEDAAVDDDVTRIGTPAAGALSPAAAFVPGPATAAVKPPAPSPPIAKSSIPKSGASRKSAVSSVLVGSVTGAALFAAAVGFFAFRHGSTPAAQPAAAVAPRPIALSQLLGQKMDAVIAAAAKVGRTEKEVSKLRDARANIVAEAALAKDAAAAPAIAQLNAAATQMYLDEASVLGRAARRLWKNVDEPADAGASVDGGVAVAALQQAKSRLDASLAIAPAHLDAAHIIDGTRLALVEFGLFQDAYAAATPSFAPAKRKDFTALNSAVQGLSAQIVALAAVPKPWLLASSARKQAYQLRQDNAAQATALAAQLSALSATIATVNDFKQLDAAVAQANAAKKTMDSLFAASSAASP